MFRKSFSHHKQSPYAGGPRNGNRYAPRARDARVSPDRYVNKAMEAGAAPAFVSVHQFTDFDIAPTP